MDTKYNTMVTSLLDNDISKFHMGQAIFHQRLDYQVCWELSCREGIRFTKAMVEEVEAQIKAYCGLRFTERELAYLESFPWTTSAYLAFLEAWRPKFWHFHIQTGGHAGISLRISGNWLDTSLYEYPVRCILSEVYAREASDYGLRLDKVKREADTWQKTLLDSDKLQDGFGDVGKFYECSFGSRLSKEAQDAAIQAMKTLENGKGSRFVGTSNALAAMEHSLPAVSICPQEWVMCTGLWKPKQNPAYANHFALRTWMSEYPGQRCIIQTDTVTTPCFLADFQGFLADFQDKMGSFIPLGAYASGNPILWGEQMLAHYARCGLEPKDQTLYFTGDITLSKAGRIYDHFYGRGDVQFGISGLADNWPLKLALNLTSCNGYPVGRLTDRPEPWPADESEISGCADKRYWEYLESAVQYRRHQEAYLPII